MAPLPILDDERAEMPSDAELWAYVCRELEPSRSLLVSARAAEDPALAERIAELHGYRVLAVTVQLAWVARLGQWIARVGRPPVLDGGEVPVQVFVRRGGKLEWLDVAGQAPRAMLIRAGLREDGSVEVRLALPDPLRVPLAADGGELRVQAVEVDMRDDVERIYYRIKVDSLQSSTYLGRRVLLAECTLPHATVAPGRALVIDPATITLRLIVGGAK
jgi:hypothetical protein